MSGSRTIIDEDDRLDNVHPGSILREDFLIGRDVPIEDVIAGSGINHGRLSAILAEQEAVDANADIRLARYFGVSEGFFLGLQIDFDLEEERRVHGDELDCVVRRAA